MKRGILTVIGRWRTVPIILAACLFLPASVFADSVVQGFAAKGELETGEVVALTSPPGTVEAAPGRNSAFIYGVVVDESSAPVIIDKENQEVYVATAGQYEVLVSDEHGPISSGDYISISSMAGIAAKATSNDSIILGKAAGGFNQSSDIERRNGEYNIGRLAVSISVSRNPLFKNTLAIPQPLQKLGNTIAGREVSPLKVYIALILFGVATALSLVLLIVGIKTGLTALGRNPLNRQSIVHGLGQVIGVSLAIFTTSLVGVYLLLRI